MSPTYDALLRAVCDPDGWRPAMRNPWVIECSKGRFAAATDGVRALYVADHEADYQQDTAATLNLSQLLDGVPEPTHQIDRDELIAAIGCGEVWRNAAEPDDPICDRCNGYGEIECALGHFHDCPDCENAGKQPPSDAIDPLAIGGMPNPIDAKMARGIFERLPGNPILLSAHQQPRGGGSVCFRGPGWTFVVACLRAGSIKTWRAVEAQPVITEAVR